MNQTISYAKSLVLKMPVFQTPLWLMCYDHELDPGGVGIPLTHCPLEKMTNILQAISQMNFECKFSSFDSCVTEVCS